MPTTSYKEIIGLRYNLAPSQLTILDIPNKNIKLAKDLLDRKLKFSDNGNEIGSINYISRSSHFFIRAKALQPDYFLPILDSETAMPIRPQVFTNFDLKEGDLIISKDSNIGEIVILDKDYPNYTISGALYKLPITKNKFYIFAFIKHNHFRKQLDLLVPKGSTIRHAKSLFLDCKIPFPNQKNAVNVIKYVELLTQAIINKEKVIRRKNKMIFDFIEKELLENQKEGDFKFVEPTFREIEQVKRLDTGMYNLQYKKTKHNITNYKYGFSKLEALGYKITRGQNLQISNIGRSIYSDIPKSNFYKLILSKNFTEWMTVTKEGYLGNAKKLKTIQNGDIIFSCRGDLGRTIIFCGDIENTITNIDNVHIVNKQASLSSKIFIGCFLNYLRKIGFLSLISITGSGADSFTKYHFDLLDFPNFSEAKQKEISSLYHNPTEYAENLNSDNFLEQDTKWNEKTGIIELDKSMKQMKEHLDTVLDKIVNDETILIDFCL